MKEVYTYQELAPSIEQGQAVTFTAHLHAQVTLIHLHDCHVGVTIRLSRGETALGVIQQDYASIEDVLDVFDIDVYAHMWEAG